MQVGSTGSRGHAGTALLPLAAAIFINTYDSTAMNVALSDIADDLGTTITGVQAAITLYALVMAAFMITGSKLGTYLGAKRAFRIGIVVYGVGALITSLSPGLPVLLFGWSLVEGIGSAIAQPTVLQICTTDYEGRARSRAFGAVSAASGLAIGLAPIIAGVIVTMVSWRLSFALEAGVVVVILVMSRRLGPDIAPRTRQVFDLVGAGLSAAGLALVVLGILVLPTTGGWTTLALMVAGIVVLAVWVRHERRVKERGGDPLVDLMLFRIPRVVAGLVGQVSQWLTQNGTLFVVPVFVQIVLGYNAIETGLTLLPMSLAILAASVVGQRVVARVGIERLIRAGFVAMLSGGLVLIAVLGTDTTGIDFLVPLFLFGLGMGLLISQLQELVQSAAPPELVDAASGVSKSMSNLGASLGTAVAGAVMIATLVSTASSLVEDSTVIPASAKAAAEEGLHDATSAVSNDHVQDAARQAGASADVQDEVVRINDEANVTAMRAAIAVLTGIGIASFTALSLTVRRRGRARGSAVRPVRP